MKTIAENEALSPEEKVAQLKVAKGGTWYDGWRPYCMAFPSSKQCTSPRMKQEKYGFRCPDCGNMIGWDCTRLEESPLNNPEYVKMLDKRNEAAQADHTIYLNRYSKFIHN